MPKKVAKRRGRPPIFVRNDEGRVLYGLSSQTIIKGGRRRTRFYATFNDPATDKRRWFGMDDLAGAIGAFFDWVNANGWTVAYLRKTGQSFLIPRLRQMHRHFTSRDYVEAYTVPGWLVGRNERSCPMGDVSITAGRAFFLPSTSRRSDEATLQSVLGDMAQPLTPLTKKIVVELVTSLQYGLGRSTAEWLEIGLQQLRDSTRISEGRMDKLLAVLAKWSPRT